MSAAVKTNVVPLPRRPQNNPDDFTKPYPARGEDEHTKPYAYIPLDWIGEDEVTVKWETVRRDLPPPPPTEAEPPPRAFRGIGPRGAGVLLGVVLGVAVSIGTFGMLLGGGGELPARTAQAATIPDRGAETARVTPAALPEIARFEPASFTPPQTARPELTLPVVAPPSAAPVAAVPNRPEIVPLGQARSEAQARKEAPAPRKELAQPLLNVDATQRAHVILDGHPIGMTPRRIPVTPGEHVVVFLHPTKGRRTLIVEVPKDRVAFATAKF